jgi:hypothetical protein
VLQHPVQTERFRLIPEGGRLMIDNYDDVRAVVANVIYDHVNAVLRGSPGHSSDNGADAVLAALAEAGYIIWRRDKLEQAIRDAIAKMRGTGLL